MKKRNGKKGQSIAEMKRGVEKNSTKFEKPEKELKPLTKSALTGLRVFVYIVLIGIVIIGVIQILRSKQPKIIENIHKYEFSESESEGAKSFAESFAKSYMTYGKGIISDSQYIENMRGYVVDSVTLGKPQYASGTSEVIDSRVMSVNIIDEKHSDIIVKIEVKIVNDNVTVEKIDPESGEKVSVSTEMNKVYVISVPIVASEQHYAVNDYPSFLSVDYKLDAVMETYSSDEMANSEDKEEIKTLLEDFYDVYYSGTNGQIKAFFKEDMELESLNDEFSFNSIKNIEVFEGNNIYSAVVIIQITQNDIGSIFNQRHLVELEKNDTGWVIRTIKFRGN